MAFGAFFFVDTRHAQQVDVVELQQRLDINDLYRLLRKAEEEMYHYRKLRRGYPDDETIKEKLREAEEEVRALKERIKRRLDEN